MEGALLKIIIILLFVTFVAKFGQGLKARSFDVHQNASGTSEIQQRVNRVVNAGFVITELQCMVSSIEHSLQKEKTVPLLLYFMFPLIFLLKHFTLSG